MTRNKRERKPRLPEGDDGHTIANMNVEGMPWYKPERPDLPPESRDSKAPADGLTRRQMRMYTASALKAGLLVAGVMCLGMVAFVAFCVFVWFR
ncbi:MAG: hypothetical protein ACI4ML_06835 [Aristaeellaceae bacterium]